MSELNKIYSAERQILEALPSIMNQVGSEKLKMAITEHLEETKWQATRLEEIAREMNVELSPHPSKVMNTLINELHDIARSDYEPHVKDAGIIAGLQNIKHMEIASYGHLKAFARNMKLRHVERLLHSSSQEAGRFDRRLTEIAEGKLFSSGVNAVAMKMKEAA